MEETVVIPEVIPTNTRYVPFTQQKYCCVPTCLQMIMYRHGIPLVSAEVLGYELGLIVPAEDRQLFWNARTGERPPAGWGTQIGKPEFSANAAFERLGIPLSMTFDLIDKFDSVEAILKYLRETEQHDGDVVVSFENSILVNAEFPGGHAALFDRLSGGKIRLVNPARPEARWLESDAVTLFDSLKAHEGPENLGGFWKVSVIEVGS